MRRPSDRRVDRSPYSSGNIAYLSPPSDSFWRRASSDSAIHQSLIQTPVSILDNFNDLLCIFSNLVSLFFLF